jgi:hypothetical protein
MYFGVDSLLIITLVYTNPAFYRLFVAIHMLPKPKAMFAFDNTKGS